MKPLRWQHKGGGSVDMFPPSKTTYRVKWRGGVKSFKSAIEAESFYNSIEPESENESKALWEVLGGFFPELVEEKVATTPESNLYYN